MRIAFTGPAIVNGIHLERKLLIDLAKEKGHTVHNRVDSTTDLLVCNYEFLEKRKTTKVDNAAFFGTTITSPHNFLQHMGYS